MALDLVAAADLAESLARRSGPILVEALQRPREVSYKGVVDLVTEFDKQSEKMIVGGILDAYPDHHIVGEEGGGQGAPIETAPYRWYIDPLDGTSNFAHGIPHFAVSIALAGPDDRPLMGIVFDPNRGEMFRAIKGQGATLNGKPMRVSAIPDISQAAMVTGFPHDRWTNPDNNLEEFSSFLVRAQSVSRMGSAALNLCYVAAGRFDGFWEMRVNLWDIEAGLLLVTEAGGRLSDYHGREDLLYKAQQVVASNGLIHDRMLTIIVLGKDAPRPGK
jgi:myo-inositol-1(or 4)-monophosphatase